ncbi:MAG: hypothetical protein J6112_08830 [Clostridia bacterium]|nr:hypothetical protein [Clostridia bacterium]
MIPLKYPVLLVHGMTYRDDKRICYFGRIPKRLEAEGIRVFFGGTDSNGSVDDNAVFLADRISRIAEENNIEKFNVIAFSKGGLDARKAISGHGAAKYVASLTAMAVPHKGSETVDFFMKMPKWMMKAGCAVADLWFRIIGDKHPKTYEAIRAFTTEQANKFNDENPDDPGVYYQSYAFSFKTPFSDMMLFLPHLVVKHFDGENDGLVAPRSAEWGRFRGIVTGNSNRGVSHCDAVDLRRRHFTKKEGPGVSDITDLYVDVVRELAEAGY